MQKPSLGRIVLYRPYSNETNPGWPALMPGIVTKVHDDDVVDIFVFPAADGAPHSVRGSVQKCTAPLAVDDPTVKQGPMTLGTWDWPPRV